MKRTILIISVLLLLVGGGLYYRFSRIKKTYYDIETNRKVIAEYNRAGQLDGQTFAYENKKLRWRAQFKDGLKNGFAFTYYDNGKRESVIFYIKGKEEGLRTIYYRHGKIKSKENWNHGKLYGNAFIYSSNGKLDCYNAYDILGEAFYLYKLDKTGTILKNQGLVFSRNIYFNQDDSVIILKNGNLYGHVNDLNITVSSPPGLKSEVLVTINNENLAATKVDAATFQVVKPFSSNDRYTIKIIGKLSDKNSNIVKVDSAIISVRTKEQL